MERPKPVAWQPDRLLRVLLTWTSLTTLVFWLPTVRCAFDGRSYEWGLGRMRGAGLSGDYWFPVLGAALACWLVTRGWRGARPPFRWVFPAWHAALAVVITERAIALGDRAPHNLADRARHVHRRRHRVRKHPRPAPNAASRLTRRQRDVAGRLQVGQRPAAARALLPAPPVAEIERFTDAIGDLTEAADTLRNRLVQHVAQAGEVVP